MGKMSSSSRTASHFFISLSGIARAAPPRGFRVKNWKVLAPISRAMVAARGSPREMDRKEPRRSFFSFVNNRTSLFLYNFGLDGRYSSSKSGWPLCRRAPRGRVMGDRVSRIPNQLFSSAVRIKQHPRRDNRAEEGCQ